MKEYKHIQTSLGSKWGGGDCFETDIAPLAKQGWSVIHIHVETPYVEVFLERDIMNSMLLMMNDGFRYNDDQYVSPKVIEEYTGYSDTTVRHKLAKAVSEGLVDCHRDLILDADGNIQYDKSGRERRERPRYRWGDIKILFCSRRIEILNAHERDTQVEELEPYNVHETEYLFRVMQVVEGGEQIVSEYRKSTHPHAKEAAEAECARLNAGWRKEHSND